MPEPGSGAAELLLGGFLECDLQSDSSTEMLIERIAEVRSGKRPSWHRSGNAYFLDIHPDHALIEETFQPEGSQPATATLTLEQLDEAACQWLTAINHPARRTLS
jgi:hypothetical protein